MPELSQMQDLINVLGWTLVHFLWQGLGIGLAYWLVCRFTPPGNALLRYWAGMLAFLVAAIIPVVTFVIYWNSATTDVSVQAYVSPIVPMGGDLSFSALQLLRISMEPALPFVVVLWSLGVALLSARALLGWIGAHRLVSLGTSKVDDSLQAIFQRLMSNLEIQQCVRILRSSLVTVPTVIGWVRPVILLPVAVINRLPRDQLEMIIAHELGHIRRWDYLFNLLQVVIETLFFYHPAIRWMSKQVRQEREHCCDDLVIAQCNQPALYARALANLEIMRDAPVPAMAMAATGGDLIQRLHRIIRKDMPGKQSGFAQLVVMLGVATLVSVSAHQGLELRNHFLDGTSHIKSIVVTQPEVTNRSRSAWVQGISSYSRLRIEADRRNSIETTVTTAAMPSAQGTEATRVAVADIAEPGGPGVPNTEQAGKPVNQAGLARHDKQFYLPETPVTFGIDKGEGEFTKELALLLSSTMWSKTHHKPVLSNAGLPDSLEVQFEITAETMVAPVYPFKARRQLIDGFVRLEFSVDQSGHAMDIRVVDAHPAEIFEKSAISALEKWVFKVDGNHPENKRLYQLFDFDMENKGPELLKRERRCEIAGSRICGLQRYN